MKKPPTVKVMLVITFLQIAGIILVIGFALYAASVQPQGGSMSEFRAGFLERLGYDPATFGPIEAGRIAGSFILDLLLAGLMLLCIRVKKLLGIRIIAGLGLCVAVASRGFPLVQVILLVLSFRNSTKQYCRGESEAQNQVED